MIMKVYEWLLYHVGFARDEMIDGQDHITDMLKRQKERNGIWWWFGALGFLLFPIWLILHVLSIPPFG